MSLWGNTDFKASPGTVALSDLTVTGTDTFFANNFAAGDVIAITDAGGEAVISAITNETSMTLVSNTELTTGTLTGKTYAVSEKPIYVVDNGTTDADEVFGVSAAEMAVEDSKVTAVTVTAAGSGYTVRPTLTFSAPTDGTTATATAVGTVVTMTVGANNGNGYSNGDVVRVTGGTGTVANATVTTFDGNTSVETLTIVNGGAYTVLPSLTDAATTNDTGSGDENLVVDLSIGVGSTITITNAGSGYTAAPTITFAGTGGTGSAATATIRAYDSESASHAGWVKRETYTDTHGITRVKSETLVASSTISGGDNDADDDTIYPDS